MRINLYTALCVLIAAATGVILNTTLKEFTGTSIYYFVLFLQVFILLLGGLLLFTKRIKPLIIIEVPLSFSKLDIAVISDATHSLLSEYHCLLAQNCNIKAMKFTYYGIDEVTKIGLEEIEKSVVERMNKEWENNPKTDIKEIALEWFAKLTHEEKVDLSSKYYTHMEKKTAWEYTDVEIMKVYNSELIKENA